MSPPIHLLKLGGSLLDLPDLPTKLAAYRATLPDARLAMLVGGGEAADIVRRFDASYTLDQETGHWLAVRAMQLNTHLVATKLDRRRLVSDLDACHSAWETADLALVDPLAWLEQEHARGRSIPHRWTFTSDSIAAHLALQLGASRLTLLKSTLPPAATDVQRAAELGIVDPDFPQASARIPSIQIVDLRTTASLSLFLRPPRA